MFKIGNFYYPDGGGTFWENLFISVLSAAIGVIIAWRIFTKTIRHEKKVDEDKRRDYLIGRMKFLAILLKEVISTTEKQVENFLLQGEEILNNPYEYHLVKILASNQLKRLTDIDNQDIFEAYIFLFENDQITIRKYISLLNYFDFLEQRLKQAFASNESNIRAIGKRQDQMKIYVDELYSNFPKFCHTDPSMNVIWADYFPAFETYVGSGRVDVQKLHNDFLIPLFKKVKSINANDKVNQNSFIANIRNATTTIEHYKLNNFRYGIEDALILKSDLEGCLIQLKNYSKEIEEKLVNSII
ncbi:hypothetical protein [Pedobacter suwonensis]|uniref:hypothetical protein n=1 Tax=Pedobacter suwonensis TaxID=332999 RepID=UPI0036CEF63B